MTPKVEAFTSVVKQRRALMVLVKDYIVKDPDGLYARLKQEAYERQIAGIKGDSLTTGASAKHLADALGVSQATVHRAVRQLQAKEIQKQEPVIANTMEGTSKRSGYLLVRTT